DYCRDVPTVAGVYKISDYAEETRRDAAAGRIVVNCDAMTDARTAARYETTYAPHGERAYVAVPLLREGRWVAELWISDDVPRQWSGQDVALLQSVAERVWTAVEKLRVLAALRDSEAQMQFIGERSGVGYWYWEILPDRLMWSSVCRRLFGIPEEVEMTYARFLDTLHADDRPRIEAVVAETLATGREYDVELRVPLPDGSTRWMQSKGSATFENGMAVRMAGIAFDVTRRKTLELEREELLARERRLRAAADEASVAKDHFLALLSHELRTPMTTILGWASFLGTTTTDLPTLHTGIASIEQASRVQARLIDDLLDVSRIVTGKLAVEEVLLDLREPVRAAIEMIVPAAQAAEVEVEALLGDGPRYVSGDATRLQQIAWNLLTNAVKFTRGGRVEVSLHDVNASVELRVRDTGIGIEPRFLPHVFERFRQGDAGPARRFGGLGLGLSIVRNLVELHRGSVEAFSEGNGSGAEFRVRFPRALAPEAEPRREEEIALTRDALAGLRIVVVDDDPGAREIIGTILSGFGARVVRAASAEEALPSIEGADVLISDIGMAGEDGYAFLERLRLSGADLPAIAVTAYADARDRDRAFAAGFQAHLAKPVEPRTLVGMMVRVMRKL
ncbi:MAG TPA: ATP-binding protein, partial [Thermoanaerobaculia bacterium]